MKSLHDTIRKTIPNVRSMEGFENFTWYEEYRQEFEFVKDLIARPYGEVKLFLVEMKFNSGLMYGYDRILTYVLCRGTQDDKEYLFGMHTWHTPGFFKENRYHRYELSRISEFEVLKEI